jgi:hypothetical protein
VSLIRPGTRHFGKLSVFDQYEAVLECILDARRRKDRDDLDRLDEVAWYVRGKCALADPAWDFEHDFWLPDKGGKHVLLHPHPAQAKIVEHVYGHKAEGRPVRLLLPKSRRHGISQIIAAIIYREVRLAPNLKALVMAHDSDSTKEIFEKYRYFHRFDPFAPVAERSSTTELQFANIGGRIVVMTAGITPGSKGHGFGFHFLHISEAARLKAVDPDDLITGLLTTLPGPEEAWTAAFLESTGNGMDGLFYEECLSVDDPERESQWERIFLPWFERYDASVNFPDAEAKAKFEASLSAEEKLFVTDYGCTLEQVNWWRREYRENIKGANSAERRRRMREQHPSNLLECFQAFGGQTFDTEKIDAYLRTVNSYYRRLPPKLYSLTTRAKLYDTQTGTRRRATPEPILRSDESGPVTVFRRKHQLHRYAMGVDLAEGVARGDYSVIMVFDRDTREFVCRYRDKPSLPEMVDIVRMVSKYWNDAIINIETNFYAQVTEELAQTDRRRFLYWRTNTSRTRSYGGIEAHYGWKTTETTKRHMVAHAKTLLEEEPGIWTDKLLLEEMRTFREERSKTTGATKYVGAKSKTAHDDVWVAAMLALFADMDMPQGRRTDDADDLAAPKPTTIGEKWDAHVKNSDAAAAGGSNEWEMVS